MRTIFHPASLILFFLLGIGIFPAGLHAQSWYWARGFSGGNYDNVTGIGADGSGNVYVVGTFEKSIRFNTTTLTNGNFTGLFVAKYSTSGNLLWAVSGTGSGEYRDPAIAVDAAGNCYITGSFSNGAAIGSTTLASAGDFDTFVARCDSAGNFLWARRAGGEQADFSRGIAIDNSGNSYITGSFRGLATFASLDLVSAGLWDVFVAKYSPNGDVLRVNGWGGANIDNAYGISVDPAGNSYITGDFVGTAQFGSVSLVNQGAAPGTDIFVAKIGTTGQVVWAQRAGSINSDRGLAIAVDNSGNSYVTGFYIGQATFGSLNIDGFGLPDVFVAKYDGNGTATWVRSGGGGGQDMGFDITLDRQGNIYTTGRYEGEFTEARFGGVQLTDAGNGDAFVASYDTSGAFRWAHRAGSGEFDQGTAITADIAGNVTVGGTFDAGILFDTLPISGSSTTDGFVARIGPAASIITGAVAPGPYCAGQTFNIPFTVTGPFNLGNIFTAQLSDSSGGFDSPTVLGTLAGTTSGTISTTVPASITGGTRYRVRVIASNPQVTGADNGADIGLSGPVVPVVVSNRSLTFCEGDSVMLDAGAGYSSYLWSNGATTRTITVRQGGDFSVLVATGAGCSGSSVPVMAVMIPLPATPVITQNGPELESTEADSYQWLLNDAEITGATGRRYTVAQSGLYRVRIGNAAGCTTTSDAVNVAVTGVEYHNMAGAPRIYPQPTHGEFTLELAAGAGEMVRVVVRNGLGEEVLRLEESAGSDLYRRVVDLRAFPAGIYHVEMESGAGRWNGKVVMQ